jgi:hypothetical protein
MSIESKEAQLLEEELQLMTELSDVSAPYKRRLGEIRRALFKINLSRAMNGNMVWCRNGEVASIATPCREVRCKFKEGVKRLATSAELEECRLFQITEPSPTWNDAIHIFPRCVR